jgi:TolB-like protein
MAKPLALAFVSVLLGAPVVAAAQCPDGSPPPCRGAARSARPAPVALNPRGWIVVPFTNVTRTPELEWLRDGAVNLLSTDLAKWNDLVVVPDKRVADLVRTVPAGRTNQPLGLADGLAVARSAGAAQLVMGDLFKQGAGARIVANVFDARTGEKLRSVTQVVPVVDSVFGQMGTIARGLLAMAPPPNAKTGDIGTTRVDAYQAYLRGMQARNRMELEQAERAFREAVSLDSTFALAQLALANVIGWTEEVTPDRQRAALAAQRFARGLSARDQALVDAAVAGARGDEAARCQAVEPIIQRDTTDVEALFVLADCTLRDYRTVRQGIRRVYAASINRALWASQRAIQVDPAFYPAFERLEEVLLTRTKGFSCDGCSSPALFVPVVWEADTLSVWISEDSAINAQRDALVAQDPESRRSLALAHRIASEWLAASGSPYARQGLADVLQTQGLADSAFRVIANGGVNFALSNPVGTERAIEIAYRSGHPREALAWLDSARKVYGATARGMPLLANLSNAFAQTGERPGLAREMQADGQLARRWGVDSAVLVKYHSYIPKLLLGVAVPGMIEAESLLVAQLPKSCSSECSLALFRFNLFHSGYVARRTFPDSTVIPFDEGVRLRLSNNTAALRHEAEDNEANVHAGGAGAGANARYVHWLWLAAGDSTAALRVARFYVDSVFPKGRSWRRGGLIDPGLDIRMVKLRAELAAAMGFREEARKWLDYLLLLWSKPREDMKEEVDRLKALRAKVAGP